MGRVLPFKDFVGASNLEPLLMRVSFFDAIHRRDSSNDIHVVVI